MLLISLFTTLTNAATLESTYLDKLLHAKDSHTLSAVRKTYNDIREDRQICDIQATSDAIPWACFRLLTREKRWRLNDNNRTDRVAELNERCRSVTKKMLMANEDDFDIPEEWLSNDCRHSVQRTRAAVRYRRGGALHRRVGPKLESKTKEATDLRHRSRAPE